MNVSIAALAFAVVVSLAAPLGAQDAVDERLDQNVVVITRIEGPLVESMYVTLERAIRMAEENDALALVVEIDTPGGEVTLMDRLGMLLDRSEVRPVAYVTNEGISAGAFIAMACELIYTSEHAQIGSSYPIAIGPIGLPADMIDPGIQEKQLSYLRSKFRSQAETHDRPGMTALAQAMVDPAVEVLLVQDGAQGVCMTRTAYEDRLRQAGPGAVSIVRTVCGPEQILNMTATEAFDLGFTDGIVADREELLQTIGATNPTIIEVWPSWSERLTGFLDYIKWILLIGGLTLLYVEMKMPGFGVPGALGISLLALLLFRNYLVGLAEVPEILLVILGIVLIAVEIFVIPGFGVAGISGIVCVALGVTFSFLPFLWPQNPGETEMLLDTVQSLSLALVATLVVAFVLSKYILPRTRVFGALILDTGSGPATLEGSAATLGADLESASVAIGSTGIAQSDLRPAGKVEVDGRLLDARSEGDYVLRGSSVIIVEVHANHVVVRGVGR